MKVLAFFGSDLDPSAGSDFLQRSCREGYALLALDSDAMAAATQAGLNYTLMDDWVKADKILRAVEDAAACETGWYEPARDEFTVDGICWPEIDHVAMMWFWQNAMMAEEFGKAFVDRRDRELKVFGHRLPRPAVFTDPSDVCNVFWKKELPGKTVEVHRSWRLPKGIVQEFRRKASRRIRGLVGRSVAPKPDQDLIFLEGSVVLVLGQLEARRFAHVVTDMRRHLPEKAAAVLGGPYKEAADEMAAILGIPAATGATWPLSPRWLMVESLFSRTDTAAIEDRFWRGYDIALLESPGTLWEKALHSLKFHFKYYLGHRWPILHTKSFEFWLSLWSMHRPKAVIVTNAWTSYYLSACLAAKRLGIPTFLAAHGGVQLLPPNLGKLFVMDHVLYEGRLQRSTYTRTGLAADKLTECRGLIAENEYEQKKFNPWSSDNKWRLLALLETTGVGPNLVPLISLSAQLQALRILASPPADLNNRLDLALKVHPYYSDLGMIAAAGEDLIKKLLPTASDLHGLIDQSHLVVAVNYVGSALVHAFRAGRPVIYLLTENESMQKRRDRHFNLFTDGTTTVQTADQFWTAVREYFTDAEAAERMSFKAKEFTRRNLDSNKTAGVGEVLSQFFPTSE